MGLERTTTRPVFFTIAAAALGLAAAIGIGRFAFTPLFPLMQAASGLSMSDGGWLAAANYVGYFAGALLCALRPPRPESAIRIGLVGVAVFTIATGTTSWFPTWLAYRYLAGMASALALVGISARITATLEALGRPRLAGWVFSGIGVGIGFSGLVGLVLGIDGGDPGRAWIGMGVVAAGGAVAMWRQVPRGTSRSEPPARRRFDDDAWLLVVCYGAYGFGYIIPATFLPALARQSVPDPHVFGWTWPVFGAAAAAFTVLTAALARRVSPRRMWAFCQIVLAIGVLLPALDTGLTSLLLSAVCVGGTFVAVTMMAMQEARRIAGAAALPLMSAMTAAFAVGQIAGPILVSMLPAGATPFRVPSAIAAGLSFIGGVALLRAPKSPVS